MKKWLVLLFCLFSPCLLLTGCWDKVEVEDRDYVITMGIDKFDPVEDARSEQFLKEEMDNRYTLSLSIADLSSEGGKKEEPMAPPGGAAEEENTDVRQVRGQTIPSAMQTAELYSNKQTYFGQMKVVIFGEELLKDPESLKQAIDGMERDQNINMNTIVLAAQGRAYDAVVAADKEPSPSGLYIWDYYKNNVNFAAATEKLDLEELLISLRAGGNIVIPTIGAEEGKIRFGGGAVLSDATLVGFLSDREERGLLWAKGKGEGTVVDAFFEDSIIPMSVIRSRSKITFEQGEEKIRCNLSVTMEGSIDNNRLGGTPIFSEPQLKKIEKSFSNKIEEEMNHGITVTKEKLKADALNLEERLKKDNPNLYASNQAENEDMLSKLDITCSATVNIRSIGVIK